MRLRQVPRHEVQGHDLRPLRRQGHAQPRPPQAHGPHRAGRPRRPHLVLQGDAQPPRHAPGHEDDQPGKDHLFPGLRRHRRRRHAAQEEPAPQRGRLPQGARKLRRLVRGRDGRRGRPEAAGGTQPRRSVPRPAPEAGIREPQGQALQAEAARPCQAAQGGGVAARFRPGRAAEQGRVDGPGVHPGHPAGPAPARAARQRQLRHQRLERSLSAHHQPQQPTQEAGGPQRPRGHHPQREADAAAVGGRAVRQQPLQAAGAGQQQPPAQVADGHDQGQAGPLPREPARQARRLLGSLGHRGRPRAAAAPVRPAQEDRAGAVPAVHHPPAQGAGPRRHHQVGQEDAGAQGRHRLGHPGGGHPQPPGAAQPGADAAPHGHPGLRAGADRGQRDPHPPAGLQGLQRRLRRRPDGRPPALVDRGAGRGVGADDVHQQHLQPGQRRPDHQPVAGHRHGLLLPHRHARRAGRVHRGRRGQEVQRAGRGPHRLRPEEARRPRPHLGPAADREEGLQRGARREGQDEDRGSGASPAVWC